MVNEHEHFDLEKVSVYLVGGAVRDLLLGEDPKDKDYVVTGSSPKELLELGYKQVGQDFPVFLHPHTKEEYALARRERSTGDSYTDFKCEWENVPLKEDLSRRDLTINSLALNTKLGEEKLIDPFNGFEDMKNKTLRHTTKAFKEDPLRVLRVARFLARLGGQWKVAKETYNLCVQMDEEGMLDHLTKERVWLEIEKTLKQSKTPSLFFDWLMFSNLFEEFQEMKETPQREDHHPEGDVWEHTMMVMDYAASMFNDSEITFACLLHDLGKPASYKEHGNAHGHENEGLVHIEYFCNKWKVPKRYKELALLVCKYHTKVHGVLGRGVSKMTKPNSIMKLFEETNALNDPQRFEKMLSACEADAKGRGKTEAQIKSFLNKPYLQKEYLLECLNEVKKVNTKEISKKLVDLNVKGTTIGYHIRIARIDAIRVIYKKWKGK